MSKVKALSTHGVAIRCGSCFLWKPIVSFAADFSLEWLGTVWVDVCMLPCLGEELTCALTHFV